MSAARSRSRKAAARRVKEQTPPAAEPAPLEELEADREEFANGLCLLRLIARHLQGQFTYEDSDADSSLDIAIAHLDAVCDRMETALMRLKEERA